MINDISAGRFDPTIYDVAAKYHVPVSTVVLSYLSLLVQKI